MRFRREVPASGIQQQHEHNHTTTTRTDTMVHVFEDPQVRPFIGDTRGPHWRALKFLE